MREKYESLSVSVLKELAKARGIKSVSAMKKSQVIEAMLALDEKEGAPAQEMIAAPEKKVQEAPAASAEADVPEAHSSKPGTDGAGDTGRAAGTGIRTSARPKLRAAV